jgi:hypothetical protein
MFYALNNKEFYLKILKFYFFKKSELQKDKERILFLNLKYNLFKFSIFFKLKYIFYISF